MATKGLSDGVGKLDREIDGDRALLGPLGTDHPFDDDPVRLGDRRLAGGGPRRDVDPLDPLRADLVGAVRPPDPDEAVRPVDHELLSDPLLEAPEAPRGHGAEAHEPSRPPDVLRKPPGRSHEPLGTVLGGSGGPGPGQESERHEGPRPNPGPRSRRRVSLAHRVSWEGSAGAALEGQ